MAIVACKAVTSSASDIAMSAIGRPSMAAWRASSPDSAWMTGVYAARPASGPACPNPDTDAITSAGLLAASSL